MAIAALDATGWSAIAVAVATSVLVVITGYYAKQTHDRVTELRAQRDAEAAKAAPRLTVHVTECRVYKVVANDSTVNVTMIVDNRSSEPDVMEDIAVTFENVMRSVRSGAVSANQNGPALGFGPGERAVVAISFHAGRELVSAVPVAALIEVESRRGAKASEDFTMPLRV